MKLHCQPSAVVLRRTTPAHLYATPPLHSICIGPASAAERLPSSRWIESARTHRVRACAPPLRASDTTLRLTGTCASLLTLVRENRGTARCSTRSESSRQHLQHIAMTPARVAGC